MTDAEKLHLALEALEEIRDNRKRMAIERPEERIAYLERIARAAVKAIRRKGQE